MDKWEYKTLRQLVISASWETNDRIKEILDSYGEHGWECVSSDVKKGGGGFPFLTATFKRKIGD